MPAGRPTKYDPKMCETVVYEMSRGCSKCEVAAALGICEDTLYDWLKDDNKKEFSHIAINILPRKNAEYKTVWYESDFKTKVSKII